MHIKQYVKTLAEKIFQAKWYPNKKILLESIPDLGSQTYPVYEYMLSQGLNNEYKLIWLVKDKKLYKDLKIKNVRFMNFYPQNKLEKIHKFYTLCTSRAMLYSHEYIGKIFDKQVLVFLRHGSFIKSRLQHSRKNEVNESDLCICPSDFFTEIDERQLKISRDKFIYTCWPTNDYLFTDRDYSKYLFKDESFDKVIVWLPTFRKTRGERVDSTFNFPLGIPCLYSESQCKELNNELVKNNVLLVLKPHPSQDVSLLKNFNLSNFRIIGDEDLEKAGIHLYQYLGSSDAMITDYSSVYYDYLLTGKMLGVTVDDFDYYAKDTGFSIDYFNTIVGEYMKNHTDMIKFINKVANGQDDLRDKRIQLRDKAFKYCDNRSSERVYDEVMSTIEKRYK